MIRKAPAFITSDNTPFFTAESAQKHELGVLFVEQMSLTVVEANETAQVVLNHKDFIVDILTTTAKSKPAARKINGGKKTRKTTEVVTPAVTETTTV